MPDRRRRVCVIGGGPGGMAAGIWCARLGRAAGGVEAGDRLGGQLLTLTNEITDYPGFPSTDGPSLAARFVEHLRGMEVPVRLGVRATALDLPHVHTAGGGAIEADAVVLALGVRRRALGLPREAALVGRGVSYSVTRDADTADGDVGVVVGGGDAALEGALILSDVCREVHLVHRRELRAREDFIESVRARANVRFHPDREVVELLGEGRLAGVVLDDGARLDCRALFVRVGVEPRLGSVGRGLATDADGYLEVDRFNRCEDRVYAVGDICSPDFMSISAAVGQAMIACKHIQLTWRRAGV